MFASKIGFWLAVGVVAFAALATSAARQVAGTVEQIYSSNNQVEARHSSAELLPDGDLTKYSSS